MDERTRTLVARAQARDQEAIDELFERYRDRLRSALRRLLGGRYRHAVADSEDAAQDAIVAALTRIDAFEYRGEGSFLAWLLKCAEFEILQRLRSLSAQKRNPGALGRLDATNAPEPAADEASPSQVAGGKEFEERLRQCLDELPTRERDIIMLRRYLGLDTEEIRVELDLPTAGAVRALLSRAQARLADLLADA
ncbi:MAG: RNA polymerase sigma factor [Planctomycetes bacterium]|nr:RNA polymerase sigma factor [Planctomycetota bacterium]